MGTKNSKKSVMEPQSNKKDFFISYNHHDEDAARWIAWQLEKEGYTTIIQAWDFLPGNNFVEKMDDALKACKSTIALLSDHYLQSGFTKAEWQAAFAKDPTGEKRSLIPIRIQSCDLAGLLGQIIYIDLVGLKEEEAKKKLLESVRSTRLKPGKPPPFKGFETRHVFGLKRDEILKKRETELKELLEKTIKHNYHMTLKLEQEIEKEIEIKDEETGKIEKRKELVWEEVGLEKILEDKNNYILVNPSGMGKTTFLTYIACNLFESNKDYELFPFLTTCIEINKRGTASSLHDFIQRSLESFYYNSETSTISQEWGNAFILIDALDQARDVDDITSSLHLQNKYNNYRKAKVIISSRQNTAGKIKEGFNKIRLKLPEDDELLHYLGEEYYNNLKSLIDSSRELVTVPVLLEMLKIIVEKGHLSSKIYNHSTLYTEFTRILIDQERNKPRYWQNPPVINNFINYELEQSLEKIAFFSLANNEILEISKDKLVKYCETPERKEALLNTSNNDQRDKINIILKALLSVYDKSDMIVRMDAAISFKNIAAPKDINLIEEFIFGDANLSKEPQRWDEDEIDRKNKPEALSNMGTSNDMTQIDHGIVSGIRKWVIEQKCDDWNLSERTKSTLFRDKIIADAKDSGCIGTSEEITFLESQLNKGCMGAVEAIEYIYKRSNPKLKIIEASPEIEEK